MFEMTYEEFCKNYLDCKYLYCETLDGKWWYKDIETGEDLPIFSQPVYITTEEKMRKKYKEFIEQGIIKEMINK